MKITKVACEVGHRLEGHPNEVEVTVTLGLPGTNDCGLPHEAKLQYHVPLGPNGEVKLDAREIVGMLLLPQIAATFDQAEISVCGSTEEEWGTAMRP